MVRWLIRMDWPGRLVLIGILLTLSSALISQSLISKNEERLLELNQQATEFDHQIREQWDSLNRQENAILLTGLLRSIADEDSNLSASANDIWDYYIQQGDMTDEAQSIRDILNAKRRSAIDRIDQLYIDRLNMQQEQLSLEHDNRRLSSIAFMLQIIGLILVVSRDLAGRR